MSSPEHPAPSPAHKTIADAIENAPAFSAGDSVSLAVPIEGEQPAKRGRGRPKGVASAAPASAAGDGATPPPPPPDDGAAWPFGFEMRDNGLWHCPKNENPSWLCGPFEVLGMVRTAESVAWSLYLRFADPDGGEQCLSIAYAELQGDGVTVRRALAERGLAIGGRKGNREKLIEALAGVRTQRRLLLVAQTGWHADGKCFALPHMTIAAPDAEPVVFEGRARGAHFGGADDLAGWREHVAPLAAGQDRLLLSLGLALSGPLLEPLGLDGGGVHLVGGSSIGKTSAERLAGSIWGGGGALGYAQSWRATANALEGVATSHNDCFLALDEIGLCEPHDLGAAAYALAGGQGKGRMRSDSELRSRSRWRLSILSSGELGLAARIAEGARQQKARAGQEVRIVDLQADAGRGFGLFDHPGPTGNARDLADAIRDATQNFYGTAGPAFVEVILNRRPETIAAARAIMKAFMGEHVPEGANGQVARVAQRFALAATAGEIAISAAILPFDSSAVLEATARLFKSWIAARGGVGAGEARAAVETIRMFIQAHGKARFNRLDDEDGESNSFRIQMAAGYYSKGKGLYYFSDAGWQEALTGLDRSAAAKALFAAGFLLRDSEGKNKIQVRISGEKQRLFAIRSNILEGDDND